MNRTVVITGTTSGFGRDSVRLFASQGWNVVATVRKETDLAIHNDLSNVKTLLLDVNDEGADTAFAEQAAAQFGGIDALVNNAGYYHMGPVEASSMEQIHDQFQTNVFGLMALTKAFLPYFREQRSGVIVNISSISADQGYPYTAVYAASKAAVAAFSEGLNIEMAAFGVSVKAVFPGAHATRIFTKIDQAGDIPEDYQPGMERFFGMQGTGSSPAVTAQAIYQAVTDGRIEQVRYYTGPDGVAVPRVKQLPGRRLVLGGVPQRRHRQPQRPVEEPRHAGQGARRVHPLTHRPVGPAHRPRRRRARPFADRATAGLDDDGDGGVEAVAAQGVEVPVLERGQAGQVLVTDPMTLRAKLDDGGIDVPRRPEHHDIQNQAERSEPVLHSTPPW